MGVSFFGFGVWGLGVWGLGVVVFAFSLVLLLVSFMVIILGPFTILFTVQGELGS